MTGFPRTPPQEADDRPGPAGLPAENGQVDALPAAAERQIGWMVLCLNLGVTAVRAARQMVVLHSAGLLGLLRVAREKLRRSRTGHHRGAEHLRVPGPVARALDAERDLWFVWSPVLVGAGVALYFSLPTEPGILAAIAPAFAAMLVRQLARRGVWACVASGALLAMTLGFAAAKLRTEWVRAPTIDRPTRAIQVHGWLEALEPRAEGQVRLTLRLLSADGIDAGDLPYRVRITSRFGNPAVAIGERVSMRAVLRPWPQPVQPGGYDIARWAWFERIGATGFAVSRPERDAAAVDPPLDLRWAAWLGEARRTVSERIRSAAPGSPGALADALITGERGAIPETDLEALRISGLAHILAISGLHMVMIAGAIYWLVRAGLAAIPSVALQRPIRGWAAATALAGGTIYLLISGASIATQRAYIMIALMFISIMLGRRGISLRNLALAALAILLLQPETLLSASFQMSFAAVTGLVSMNEFGMRWLPKVTGPDVHPARRVATAGLAFMAGIMITTVIASIAISPISAYHFHQLSSYSLVANALAMPIFSLLVMPMVLASLILVPLGLHAWPVSLMATGIEQVMAIAHWVAGLSGAVIPVAQMGATGFGLIVFGGLWMMLWQRGWRALGALPLALGLVIASISDRPDIYLDNDASQIAVRGRGDRLSAKPGRGSLFALERWLESEGDVREAKSAVDETSWWCDRVGCTVRIGGRSDGPLVAVAQSPAAIQDDCARADVVILRFSQIRPCPNPRLVIDWRDLRDKGAHRIWLGRNGSPARIETVGGARGDRPWTRGRQYR